MFKTISIIIVSVSLFGLIVFIIVKNLIKKRIEYYLKINNKKKLSKFK
jgi:hypothetical protein